MKNIVLKKCIRCKKKKPTSDFFKEKISKDGFKSSCKICNEKNRIRTWKPADPVKEKWRKVYAKFGIDQCGYNLLFEAQNGVCAICGEEEKDLLRGKTRTLCIDHCHKSNKIRGLLCNKCNTGLGLFRDNVDFLNKAIGYLL